MELEAESYHVGQIGEECEIGKGYILARSRQVLGAGKVHLPEPQLFAEHGKLGAQICDVDVLGPRPAHIVHHLPDNNNNNTSINNTNKIVTRGFARTSPAADEALLDSCMRVRATP